MIHPKGCIHLASIGPGEIIGAESLFRRISKKVGVSVSSLDCTSKVILVATSPLSCFKINLDDVVRNCSGNHGMKTHKLLQSWLTAQDDQRRGHFKRQRRLQQKLILPRDIHSLPQFNTGSCSTEMKKLLKMPKNTYSTTGQEGSYSRIGRAADAVRKSF